MPHDEESAMIRHPSAIASRLFGAWTREIDRSTLRADLTAGALVASLTLPQGIAFASLAGLPLAYGLYTAIVPCIVAALFGSSRHVVSGPTNALSLALFASLTPLAAAGSPAYLTLVLTTTLLIGLMQCLVGALRFGTLANFISPAALRGFMSGAAVLIAWHSLTDLFGLAKPPHGIGLLTYLSVNSHSASAAALLIGTFTLAAALFLRRRLPRWPDMLLALLLATLLCACLKHADAIPRWGSVATVGYLPSLWPRFQFPDIDWHALPQLLPIAFSLTIVALGQSISIAKAVAERSGQRIDANREFCGQGVSNVIGSFFSSYVSCGSLNRSLPNFEAGARTPLAAVFAASWLLLLSSTAGDWLAFIPMPAIAALLLVVACSLLDVRGWRRLWRLDRRDFAIAGTTALATVTIRMEVAILLGAMLSLLAYLYRTSRPAVRIMGFDVCVGKGEISGRPFVVRDAVPQPLPECPQLKMIRMEGDVYFGAAAHVAECLRQLREGESAPRHLLVMSKSMNFIDLSGDDLWRAEMRRRRAGGGDLYFHRPRPEVLALWERTRFIEDLGSEHIFASKRAALATIFRRLDRSLCHRCRARVFEECLDSSDR